MALLLQFLDWQGRFQLKLAVSAIVLLRLVWNNFIKLSRNTGRPRRFSFCRLFISDRTSLLFAGVIKKELSYGFFRYLEYWCFGFISFSFTCLTTEVKYLINSFAISDGLVTFFFSNLNAVDTIWPLFRYIYDFTDHLPPCFECVQFIIIEIFVKVVCVSVTLKFICKVFFI